MDGIVKINLKVTGEHQMLEDSELLLGFV